MFGIKIRRIPPETVLKSGDKLVLNIDQVDRYFVDKDSRNIDVEVERIVERDDGTKEVYVKSAPKPFPA